MKELSVQISNEGGTFPRVLRSSEHWSQTSPKWKLQRFDTLSRRDANANTKVPTYNMTVRRPPWTQNSGKRDDGQQDRVDDQRRHQVLVNSKTGTLERLKVCEDEHGHRKGNQGQEREDEQNVAGDGRNAAGSRLWKRV